MLKDAKEKKNIMPITCHFCEEIFCLDHQQPEVHNCPNMIVGKNFRKINPSRLIKVS